MDISEVFRLEKFIPTCCPKCAQPFLSNAEGDFRYDTRLLHPASTPAAWLAVFPEAAVTDGLHTEPIWCGRCRNITLRVVMAVRTVTTKEEVALLEREGYRNCQTLSCSGTGFSDSPDYTLTVIESPDQPQPPITFMPKSIRR